MIIKKNAIELEDFLKEYEDEAILNDHIVLKAIKYTLIEMAEMIANTLQHILAKGKGIPVSGYIDTLIKARENRIISEKIFLVLKP